MLGMEHDLDVTVALPPRSRPSGRRKAHGGETCDLRTCVGGLFPAKSYMALAKALHASPAREGACFGEATRRQGPWFDVRTRSAQP